MANGTGKMYYSNGDVYEGVFDNGQKTANGVSILIYNQIYTHSDGSQYQGNWFRDERSGEGVMKYANGDIYEGMWGNGERLLNNNYNQKWKRTLLVQQW